MNHYPLWKYILVLVVVIFGILYSIPNYFPEIPAVQVSTNRQSISINEKLQHSIEDQLKNDAIPFEGSFIADGSLKIRFADKETQMKAHSAISSQLGDAYIVAFNSIAKTPTWMSKIKANPLYLGLDLRGGVHFLMEVDMKAALQKKLDGYSNDIRRSLRQAKIRNGGVKAQAQSLTVSFQDKEATEAALKVLAKALPDASLQISSDKLITLTISEQALKEIQTNALQQNINTLHNRVNELGVAEPVIQQAGSDRIVIQLAGVEDTAKAKDIIGRTATLELHMVAEDSLQQQASSGTIPNGYELLTDTDGRPLLVNKQVELTGDDINNAQPGWDEHGGATVDLALNARGSSVFGDLTSQNVGKRMAMVLIDQGKKEIVTAPVIKAAITGGRVQISGNMNVAEANDTALLLRAGSLSAPMKIIEERVIGPALGKENIEKGFKSTLWGFLVVAGFMIVYYRMFGVFSVIALSCNVVLLIALLSLIQATLTLPGIAAIALTLGMAIDSNVLINERIREELRNGQPPQSAINLGYQHAWATIVDSNITSLIAGIALLIFGSGPVRGFAVVHCLGILTSIFTSVVVSRSIANLWYGRRRNLKQLSIGTVYRPELTENTTFTGYKG